MAFEVKLHKMHFFFFFFYAKFRKEQILDKKTYKKKVYLKTPLISYFLL